MVDSNPQSEKTLTFANVFPGDSKGETITCANSGLLTIEMNSGDEKLLECTFIRIKNLTTGEVLHDNLVRDFTSINVDKDDLIEYTVYFLPSMGNEYQEKALSLLIKVAGLNADTILINTGYIRINLNDGYPIIQPSEFSAINGVKKDFFIENESTWDSCVKVYLDNVSR